MTDECESCGRDIADHSPEDMNECTAVIWAMVEQQREHNEEQQRRITDLQRQLAQGQSMN